MYFFCLFFILPLTSYKLYTWECKLFHNMFLLLFTSSVELILFFQQNQTSLNWINLHTQIFYSRTLISFPFSFYIFFFLCWTNTLLKLIMKESFSLQAKLTRALINRDNQIKLLQIIRILLKKNKRYKHFRIEKKMSIIWDLKRKNRKLFENSFLIKINSNKKKSKKKLIIFFLSNFLL